uniref:Cytochrome P450 44D2 n=1 Tax=Paracyclopina nana TaxID=565004 RepID=A0A0F7DGY4_PARNA|nr:cytochrome P450 44D2 [Paracyclopina nana]
MLLARPHLRSLSSLTINNHTASLANVPGPQQYPVIGTLPSYWTGKYDRFRYNKVLKQLYEEYGPVVKENFGDRTIVHVFNPDDIKTVYSLEGKYPEIPPLMETAGIYREQKGMSLGLGFTNGEEWYRLRSNCQQKMLRPKEVQEHLPGVNKVAQDFAHRLKKIRLPDSSFEVTDLHTEVGMWNFEASSVLVLDKRLGGLEQGSQAERLSRQVVLDNKILFKYSGILKLSFPFYKYFNTLTWKKVVASEDRIYGYAMKLVDQSVLRLRDELESGTLQEGRFNFLAYLLSREALSLKDVTTICLSALLDGLSTTTPTVLFCLYCLSTEQRVQAKVYEEIAQVIGDNPDLPILPEHIGKLTYLKAFVKETFRLWPNGTEVSRYIENDMELSGCMIPAGTHVDLNPSVHFRDPKHFPEPDKHIPERWLRREEVDQQFKDLDLNDINGMIESAENLHPYILTPFGHGTRMCAGRRFAEQHIYVILATLLRHFKLGYNVDRKMDAIYHTLLFPDRPLRIQFKPRK